MIGPKVTIEKSCYECECKKVEHYAVQGDSGCYVSCSHPSVGEKHIGNDVWRTPDWCPAVSAESLRDLEVAWLSSALAGSIANLGYPVGMGIPPTPEHVKRCAETLFDRFVGLSAQLSAASPEGMTLVPTKATPAICAALRTGSHKDVPSDELCEIRWAAALAAGQKGGVA